ncbi:MAG: alpha/beta fold hydrolase, partial [Terriglobia bacterium]
MAGITITRILRKRTLGGYVVIAAVALLAPAPFAAAQAGEERHEVVRAGLATLDVTVRGRGDPIVFIPSRGRGVEDFDDLSKRLVKAGYRVILPQPRGIGRSQGPLDG